MEEEFYQREQLDGVRFSWNFWPSNKVGQARGVVPVSALYTPLKEIENLAVVQYEPVKCPKCGAILNPFCNVDFRFKTWECNCCHTKNNFTGMYQS